MSFSGVYSVLATPFTPTGDVDFESLKRVVDLAVKAGVNGVTALGVTGEVARLDDKERGRIVDTVVEHMNGRATVIVGATDGAADTGTDPGVLLYLGILMEAVVAATDHAVCRINTWK